MTLDFTYLSTASIVATIIAAIIKATGILPLGWGDVLLPFVAMHVVIAVVYLGFIAIALCAGQEVTLRRTKRGRQRSSSTLS